MKYYLYTNFLYVCGHKTQKSQHEDVYTIKKKTEKFKAVGDITIIVVMIGLLKRDGIVKNTVITIFFPFIFLMFFRDISGTKDTLIYEISLKLSSFMLLMSLFKLQDKEKISWKMKI